MKAHQVLLTSLVLAGIASTPLAAGEEGVFVTRYYGAALDGTRRWEAVTRISASSEHGAGRYRIVEEGKGVYSGFAVPVQWRAEAEFTSDAQTVTPIAMEKTVTASDGTVLRHETQHFDTAAHKATITFDTAGGKRLKTKTFAYRGEITDYLLLGLYVQKFLERGEREKVFYLASGEPALYKVTARILGEETLVLNGQPIRAYKIYLDPDVGILSPLKVIAPKAYVWHAAEPPYAWLRYRGVESTISSPRVEITTMDTGSEKR